MYWYPDVYGVKGVDMLCENWPELRMQCLRRDGFKCQRCEKRMAGKLLTAHHIVPRADGGGDTLHNLVTLCSPCHDEVECEGYTSLAEIQGSYNDEVETVAAKPHSSEWDYDGRPDWHKWVYGGQRNPNM